MTEIEKLTAERDAARREAGALRGALDDLLDVWPEPDNAILTPQESAALSRARALSSSRPGADLCECDNLSPPHPRGAPGCLRGVPAPTPETKPATRHDGGGTP